jgi:dipeptidyl aminopeptidase/acylaminoacyl peptidase
VRAILALLVLTSSGQIAAQSSAPAAKRLPTSGDFVYRLKTVSDPQLAPGGDWVAYTVTTIDSAKDKRDTDVWMTSWDGSQTVQLTASPEREASPRWSPDGRSLAFLSGRQDGDGSQVWVLDRRGGEAQRLTAIKGGIDAMQWSPDSKRMVLVVSVDLDTAKTDTTKKRPVVVDRYLFKQDGTGYLTTKRSHLLLFDIATKKVDTLTSGPADDDNPQWSPDGTRIAFVRTPMPEPGTGEQSDVYVVDAHAGAAPKALTSFPGPDGGPLSWSPDGAWVAFFRTDEPKYAVYQQQKLAIVKSDGSVPPRILTAAYDRPLDKPTFAANGQSILAITDDDRARVMVRVAVAEGHVDRIDKARHAVFDYSAGTLAGAHVALLVSTPDRPAEIFASEGDGLRQLTHPNDSLMASLTLGATEDFASKSNDGTEVHSVLVRPAAPAPGSRLPLVLFIHGGPNSQNNYAFSPTAQLFAAAGFTTLGVNYRGSNGRGLAYQRAIFADWGHKEVDDLLGAVDQAVKAGLADPDRLGIGGWSYGGILTDYTIATTPRFKAAISGAGSALQLSMYGTDQYIQQYELELGPPWKSRDLWIKLSYPFFQADRIKTPTLFMGGDADFNVPIIGGQQMYQALRELGVPTQLVIYPEQYHGLTVPSFLKDRWDRYVAWYRRYLNAPTAAKNAAGK